MANALLIEIGKGKQPEEMIKDILDGKRKGTEAKCSSLPAHGLCLMGVNYSSDRSVIRTANEKN
jgi:tRNA U38,U39,U40 pseudouridine synthase TruA